MIKYNRLFYYTITAVLALSALLTFFWLRQPVSNQELLANFAKAGDFWEAAKSVRGIPWWSPMFMQGTSLAMDWSFMLTNAVMLLFSLPLGFLVGPKVAAAVCLGLGALGMFFFLRRYAEKALPAAIGAILFLCFPSVLTRAVHFEHFVVVVSLALLPWVLWSLSGFLRSPSPRSAVVFSVCFSALTLAYGKTGLMALPVLLAFAGAEYFLTEKEKRPHGKLLALVAFSIFVLSIVPNLPAFREVGFITMFQLGPFDGWQRAFSTKSAVSWLDRNHILGQGMAQGFAPTTLNGGTYAGITVFLLASAALLRGSLNQTLVGRKARLFLGLSLFTFWLSFGPRGVVRGHFDFLEMSIGAADFTPALAWFLLGIQVWIIFRLINPQSPITKGLTTGLAAIYLIVPGFRLIEFLPLYKNIRAPFDFYQVTGAVCLIAASALTAGALLETIRSQKWKAGLVVAIGLLALLDSLPYARPIFSPQMNPKVFSDFLEAQNFLKSAPQPGRVYPFSGRYFYLLTPWISGRPLVSEAFNNYLQQRGAALLQGSAFLNDSLLDSYLRIAGVAYLLIDKTDPDTPKDLQTRLRSRFSTAFENTNMLVLSVSGSMGWGFLAQEFLQTSSNGPEVAVAALGSAAYNFATIQMTGIDLNEQGFRGRIIEGRITPKEGSVITEGQAFQPLTKKEGGNYHETTFEPAGQSGWLIFNQAWHPDWVAVVDGKTEKPHRAFLAFSAIKTDGTQEVRFEFRPPWWYNFCLYIGFAAWMGALGFLLTGRGRLSVEYNPKSDTLKP